MANTIPAALVNQVVSNEVLLGFLDELILMGIFSIGVDGGGAKKVEVPIFNGKTSQTFAGSFSSGGDQTITHVEVDIDTRLYQPLHFTDEELANSPQLNIERIANQCGRRLALDVTADVLDVVTNANYGAAGFTGAASTFGYDEFVDMLGALDTKDVPDMDRTVALTPAYYRALLKDPDVKGAADFTAFSGNQDRGFSLPGARVVKSGIIPGNSENLVGFAVYPSAIALGVRYIQPTDASHGYDAAQPLAHESGLTLGYRTWYDRDAGRRNWAFDCNFGKAVAQDALSRMVSA